MTTATDRPVDVRETKPEAERTRRPTIWLIVLSILVLGMGAWIIYDYSQDTALAPGPDMAELIDDYVGAWNDYDGEAFLETTRAGYTFSAYGQTFDRDDQLSNIENSLSARAWHVELLDDPLVIGDGPWYFVSFPGEITENLFDVTHGMSVLTLVEADGGYLVTSHTFTGS
jgi:hypothetical protein